MRQTYIRVAKPKVQEVLPIPSDLHAFLKEVHRLILAEDNFAMWESDDLLQADGVYGGLNDQDGTEYGFTYYSGEYTDVKYENQATWEITLDRTEIEKIADSQITTLMLWACQVPQCGNKFTNSDNLCYYHDYETG